MNHMALQWNATIKQIVGQVYWKKTAADDTYLRLFHYEVYSGVESKYLSRTIPLQSVLWGRKKVQKWYHYHHTLYLNISSHCIGMTTNIKSTKLPFYHF